MTTSLSDAGLQLASGNLLNVAAAMPVSGNFTAGDIVLQNTTTGEVAGWKRLTTGSGNVLGTDWLAFGALGIGQTFQDMTASRALGTTYTNTTARPILVAITVTYGSGTTMTMMIGGVSIPADGSHAATERTTNTFIIPPGMTYSYSTSGGDTLYKWAELR